MSNSWLFDDPPNATSFTTTFVLDGSPILRVYHDYDGGWQFHGSPHDPATREVARVVCLGCMIERDATLNELHDLPRGWCAFRSSAKKPWKRRKNNPFPTYSENGYYLENAVWMAQYRDDIRPPSEKLRCNLTVGTYVKLIFRFAAEDAERGDNEIERMWVLVTGIDEDDNYIGTLENNPHFSHHTDALTLGDTIRFHPVHVMEIMEKSDV